jgi:hypothetical protein
MNKIEELELEIQQIRIIVRNIYFSMCLFLNA